MTLRAALLGLITAIFIAAVGYLNDGLLRPARMVEINFPPAVFGTLFILVLVVNPLLYALRRRLRFSASELAVMVALALVACSIPGGSMLRTFTTIQAMPAFWERSEVGWQRTEAMSYLPDSMLAGGGEYSEEVTEAFESGIDPKPISLDQVPWSAWTEPLSIWIPIVLLFAVASICMILVVHRQWVRHERLRYPIVEFTNGILAQDADRPLAGVLRNRMFYLGAAVVLVIHMVNGLYAWYPDSIQIPRTFDFGPVVNLFPWMGKVWQHYFLFRPTIYPIVLGFAFFLSSEISLSLGLANLVFVVVMAGVIEAGVPLTGDMMTGYPDVYTRFGAYIGLAALLLYTGRHYYGQILRQALLPFIPARGGTVVPRYAAWACRFLILSLAGLVGILIALGMSWPWALILIGMFMLMYLVMARIVAEAGLPWVESQWIPAEVMIGMIGTYAIGPAALALILITSIMFTLRTREVATLFLVNGVKIWQDQGLKPGRFGRWATGTYTVALLVAVPVVLWANYNYGAFRNDDWAREHVPTETFDQLSKQISKLQADGELEQSVSLSTWERVKSFDPSPLFLWAAGIGVVGVLVVSFLRLRYTWWPIHPILFLVAGTIPAAHFGASLLLGWFLKGAITRFGGTPAYHRAKIFMIGVVAGDLLGGLLWMVVGAIYYGVTGAQPEVYLIFPAGR